ncbi:MAG: substrate-binding domain-containing protein [Vibrio sp.]
MSDSITLLAAGSLRAAFSSLLDEFQQQTQIRVDVSFGPAGLLRERIEAGEPCSIFASANTIHPQQLKQSGLAVRCDTFAHNQLMITARDSIFSDPTDWLDLLTCHEHRIATSTPICDPSGDYTWQLFEKIEAKFPSVGKDLMERALQLVGGKSGVTIPQGQMAAAWLIQQELADIFIGYAHYAKQLALMDGLQTIEIPKEWNVQAEYQLALLKPAYLKPEYLTPEHLERSQAELVQLEQAQSLYDFILSSAGQKHLTQAGFCI